MSRQLIGYNADYPLLAGMLLLSVMVGAWLVAQPFPPLQDFPEWIYQAYLFSRVLSGDPFVQSSFAIASYPIPNSLSQVGMGLLMLVLPPMAAAKLWLALYIVAFLSVCWVALRRLKPAEWAPALVVAGGVLIFNSSFWNGYINFQFAVLLLAAFLLIWEVYDRRKFWIVAVFGIAIFFSHATISAAFILYVVVRELLWRYNPKAVWGLLPSLALLVWYVLAKDPGNVEPVPIVTAYQTVLEFGMYKAYTVMKLGPFHNFVGIDGLSYKVLSPPLYWLGVGLNIVFAVVLLGTILVACVELLAPSSQVRNRSVMLIPIGILLIAFVAAPDRIADVVNIGERFLIAALVIVLLTMPLRRSLLIMTATIVLAAVPLNAWFLLLSPATDSSSVQAGSDDIRQHGLFSHRLYQFNDQAEFLLSGAQSNLPPQAFRTSVIVPLQHIYR